MYGIACISASQASLPRMHLCISDVIYACVMFIYVHDIFYTLIVMYDILYPCMVSHASLLCRHLCLTCISASLMSSMRV
jgi:hypothetical protein